MFTLREKILSCLVSTLIVLFFLSCKNDRVDLQGEPHNPSKPIVVTSFYPTKGGAKSKILLNGENFGTDADQIEVYFNTKKAAVVSSSGSRIYAIVPRLPGDNPVIKVVVGENSATYDSTFLYTPQAQVTTVTGNGTQSFLEGPLHQAQVYGKYLDLDAEGNLFMSWRDGGTWGVARISEKENVVISLIEAKTTTERVLYDGR